MEMRAAALRRIASAAKFAANAETQDQSARRLPVVVYNIRGPQPSPWTKHQFKTLDAIAPEAVSVIKDAEAGDIIIITSTGLPTIIFDVMYSMSTFPVFFEGANTAGLSYRKGIPFIPLKDNMQILDASYTHGGVTSRQCPVRKFGAGDDPHLILRPRPCGPQEELVIVRALAQAFLDSRDPASSTFKYYVQSFVVASDPRNDQVAVSLEVIWDKIHHRSRTNQQYATEINRIHGLSLGKTKAEIHQALVRAGGDADRAVSILLGR